MQELNIDFNSQIFSAAGSLFRSFNQKNWANSTIGLPHNWSPYLISSLQFILNANTPKLLIWGEEYIQFFNESFNTHILKSTIGKSLGESANNHPLPLWLVINKEVKNTFSSKQKSCIFVQPVDTIKSTYQLDIFPSFDMNGNVCAVVVDFLLDEENYQTKKTDNDIKLETSLSPSYPNFLFSEDKFKNLIVHSSFAIVILKGSEFVVEFANEIMTKNILGSNLGSVIGKKFKKIISPTTNKAIFEQLENTLSTGNTNNVVEFKTHLKNVKNEKPFYINIEISLLNDRASNNEKRIIATVIDVTETVETKQLLKETADRLIMATDGTQLSTWALDLVNNTIIHSPKLATIFGHSSKHKMKHAEMLGQLHVDDKVNIVEPAFQKALETGLYQYEARILHKDSSTHWIRTIGKVYRNEFGEPLRMLGTLSDITEWKNAERKLAQLGEIVRSSDDAIIAKTLDGTIISWNEAAEKMFGFSEAEMVGSSILRLIPDDLYHEEVEIVSQLKKGQRIDHFETKRLTKDKKLLDISLTVSPIHDSRGNIMGASKIARDITSQKRNEKLLAQQKEQLEIVIETSGLGTWEINFQTNEVAYSDRYLEILGVPPNANYDYEILKTRLHPDDYGIREAALEKAKITGYFNYKGRIIQPKNSIHWFESKGKVFYDEANQPIKMIGTIRDLTAEKQIQQKIEESEQRFRSVADTVPVFIWMSTPDKNCNFFNKAWLNFRGKTFEEEAGYGWTNGVHPNDIDNCLAIYNGGFDTQKEFYMEYRMLRYDGEYRWISDNGVPRFTSDGIFEGFIGACMDVHERIEFEEKLKESESRLRMAAYSGELGTWDFNPENEIITWDASSRELFGVSSDEMFTLELMLSKIHPDDLKITTKRIQQAINPDLEKNFDTAFRVVGLPDQKLRWIHAKGKATFDDNSTLIRFSGTVLDITEKKIALEELQESEQRYRFLANAMPQLVWTGDANGNLDYFNDFVNKFSGLEYQQLLNGGWLSIVHPDDRDENLELWSQSIKTGNPFLFEHRFKRFDGVYRWQLSRAVALKDDEGKIQLWVGTSTDIDDLKKHEEQKNDFIKMANHELKTPVTTIKGYIQLLLKTHAESKDQLLVNSLTTVDKQVSKLTNLVSDLLDITKIERGSLPLNEEIFNIGDLVLDTIKDMGAAMPTHTIIFDKNDQVSVFADRDRISQVLINLFTNAFKYSPNATEINVRMQFEDNFIVVSIQDYGIGIAPQDQQKIFERFYRVSGKDEKTFPGFGIGLFIVNEIITLHNGKLWVDSKKDEGATFYFSLPVFKQ